MPEAISNHTTVPSRRRFLSQAAGAAAGGAVLALATIPPAPAAAAPIAALASSDVDPIFALIAAHQKAREELSAAESAHAMVERELQAAGDLYPKVTSRGNPYSGLPRRPVSKTHTDIDRYSPADLYPDDNKREHDELSAAEARRDARHVPSQQAMDGARDAERDALERLVEAVPTTMPGVMALLKFQRELWEAGGDGSLDAWHASRICDVVEEALLKLQAS